MRLSSVLQVMWPLIKKTIISTKLSDADKVGRDVWCAKHVVKGELNVGIVEEFGTCVEDKEIISIGNYDMVRACAWFYIN